MDCSLLTCPSITQFDDFTWMGRLGDIDPLENLDRILDEDPQYSEPSYNITQESKPSMCSDKMACGSTHTERLDFYSLYRNESSPVGSWESINALDLTSALDNTFPSTDDNSIQTVVDSYDTHNDDIPIQPETQFAGDVDTFMVDPLSDPTSDMASIATVPSHNFSMTCPDGTSVSTNQADAEQKHDFVNGGSSASTNCAQKDLPNSVSIGGYCMGRQEDSPEMLNSGGAHGVHPVQPQNRFHSSPTKLVHPQQSECTPSSLTMQWPERSVTTQMLDGEKMMHHNGRNVYPVSLEVKLADVARATSELKRNRAKARARRLAASQRRAKKYPLQKLIRMSSSLSSTRDKLDHHSMATSMPMLQSRVHMVPQNQFPAGGQSVPTRTANSQVPAFLPVVLQGPHVATNNEMLSHAQSVQGIPYYCYQQQLYMASGEDNRLSSDNSAMPSMHVEQDVQSLASIPMSNSTKATKSLDAALIEQLQSVLNKMNVQTRLCIRDALYRLARSSKQRQSRPESVSGSNSSSSRSDGMETQTNSIDRWIVNILFCKQLVSGETSSQAYSPVLLQATPQSIETSTTSSVSHQWNSCGSYINLQDAPLHIVTGL